MQDVTHEQYSAEEVAAFFVSSYFEELVKGQRNTNWYSDTAKTEVQNVAEGVTEYGQGGDHLGTVQPHFTEATTDITTITVEDASESLESVLVHCEGTATTATTRMTFVQQVTLFLKEGSYYIVKELFKIRQLESLIEEPQEEQVEAAAEAGDAEAHTAAAEQIETKQQEAVEETPVTPVAETHQEAPVQRSKPATPTPEPPAVEAAAVAAAAAPAKPKITYLDHLMSNPTAPHSTAPKVVTATKAVPEKESNKEKEKERERERPVREREVAASAEPLVRGHCFFKEIQNPDDAKAEMTKFLEKLGYGSKEIKSLRATSGNNGGCNVFVDLSVPNALEAFNEARDTYRWRCTSMTHQHRERPPKQQK